MSAAQDRRRPDHIAVEDLDEHERHYLLDSDYFCIIPWVHLHAHPDGRAFPCCVADMNYPIGNLRTETVAEVWNSSRLREMRRNMLAGEPSPECHKCGERERAGFFSKRNSSNKQLGHHIGKVRETRVDGSAGAPHVVYLDVRFSNLCNLSCRSCGALFSSNWYDDHTALYGQPSHPRHMTVGGDDADTRDHLWEQLYELIPQLEKVTFGGGEPLIMEEHFRLLKELDRRGMHHVRLFYHTNFTTLGYKGVDILSLWKKFNEVHVGASLDAMGARARLMRYGTDWAGIENNRRRMLEVCPEVDFFVAATLGALNSLHLPDFHRDWIEKGLIEPGQFYITVLHEPNWQRIDVLPARLKTEVEQRYRQHITWLEGQHAAADAAEAYRSALRFMWESDRSDLLPELRGWSRKLDIRRQEDCATVFPELQELWEDDHTRAERCPT